MIAPCGVNCLACSAHLDSKNPCPGCQAPIEKITRKSCRNCVKKNAPLSEASNGVLNVAAFLVLE